jgi:hypothetical protein
MRICEEARARREPPGASASAPHTSSAQRLHPSGLGLLPLAFVLLGESDSVVILDQLYDPRVCEGKHASVVNSEDQFLKALVVL